MINEELILQNGYKLSRVPLDKTTTRAWYKHFYIDRKIDFFGEIRKETIRKYTIGILEYDFTEYQDKMKGCDLLQYSAEVQFSYEDESFVNITLSSPVSISAIEEYFENVFNSTNAVNYDERY